MSAVVIPIKDVEYEHPLPGNTCDTKHAWARVPPEPTPAERTALKEKIKRLLKERNAVMVSHYYVHAASSATRWRWRASAATTRRRRWWSRA